MTIALTDNQVFFFMECRKPGVQSAQPPSARLCFGAYMAFMTKSWTFATSVSHHKAPERVISIKRAISGRPNPTFYGALKPVFSDVLEAAFQASSTQIFPAFPISMDEQVI